jgi:hypothetical protein
LISLFVWAGGCASEKTTREASTPKNGIAEYRQTATVADQAIRRALDSVATVGAQSNRCPSEVLSNFSVEIQRLQVESIQVRERSQAMQARGDAYFEQWQDNMTKVKDPNVRAMAEAKRPQLQESFQKIKSLSQEGREAFNPFLSDLRQLRNVLEKDPGSINAPATRDLMKQAVEYGQHVEKCIAGIAQELDAMSAMLVPPQQSIQK